MVAPEAMGLARGDGGLCSVTATAQAAIRLRELQTKTIDGVDVELGTTREHELLSGF